MKYFHSLLSAVVLAVLFASCEKDPELGTSFTLNIYPKIDNQSVVLGQEYMDGENYRIMPSLLKFYVAHLTLLTDNGELEIKDVALLDMEGLAAGEPLVIKADVPAGNYRGIRFWIGLDSTQNASDPSTFEQEHPLSTFQGTFWTWNSGYRFVLLEGYYDTLPNTAGPVSTNKFFNYHTGLNSLYREAVLGSASTSFSVGDGESYNYNLDLDLNNVFYGAEDMDRSMGASTHTTTNYPLAEKFTENFIRAFRLSTP